MTDLIARLEQATEGSRELDGLIYIATEDRVSWWGIDENENQVTGTAAEMLERGWQSPSTLSKQTSMRCAMSDYTQGLAA